MPAMASSCGCGLRLLGIWWHRRVPAPAARPGCRWRPRRARCRWGTGPLSQSRAGPPTARSCPTQTGLPPKVRVSVNEILGRKAITIKGPWPLALHQHVGVGEQLLEPRASGRLGHVELGVALARERIQRLRGYLR